MKNWKGIWIIAVAVLHSVFALASFSTEYQKILALGIVDSVHSAESAAVTWFFLFGILMLALGFMVYTLEQGAIVIPKSAALTLLILTILGAALMPISGFWLLFPPVLAMLYNRNGV